MGYSSDLTDKEWAIIKPLLPEKKRTRPPKWSKKNILNGIFYQLKNGCDVIGVIYLKIYHHTQLYFGITSSGEMKV